MPKNLEPIIKSIQAQKKVTFFLGAGISTSAGIPDFRSPDTGLYANLAKLNLPYAEAVFDIDYFRENPKAFYTLADELYPGKFEPTPFHFFVKLIQDKGLLQRVYTQNIDTLEREAGINDEYIVEAHGSFAYNHCIDCLEEMSNEDLQQFMKANKIPHCKLCQGLVKPDIVFFGEGLPSKFFESWDEDQNQVEIAIIAGSSLTVYPFASLPSQVDKNAIRLLINREAVGDFASVTRRRSSDVLELDDCDNVAIRIVESLGWKAELDKLITDYRDKRKVKLEPNTEYSSNKAEFNIEAKTDLERKDNSKNVSNTSKKEKDSSNEDENPEIIKAIDNLKI